MNWILTPDQFALAWERTVGDRIPYPLAVRLSARDSAERAAQLPALRQWCDSTLDADLEAALRVLAAPEVSVAAFGQDGAGAPAVRVLGASAARIGVVATQRPGPYPDRGGELRITAGTSSSLPVRVIAALPAAPAGAGERLRAPRAEVAEDGRDRVTVPVSGPGVPSRIRKRLKQSRDGIGQIVVWVHRVTGAAPFGVLCWVDIADDGRYAIHTGKDVEIAAVGAEGFTNALRPMVAAAQRSVAYAER
ncbi:ESX secretion-associated protein EspG [Nocardia sp. NBC_01329]|uniref:ESX secretion-associated protein EspG n=1 Tax=Nocardia sp. NBC_01329 TaxID=2903594 RepID=UPI002E0EB79C|nr:ESX secretion-associated protein EspG [Nocardia sp. NBC_01329]